MDLRHDVNVPNSIIRPRTEGSGLITMSKLGGEYDY